MALLVTLSIAAVTFLVMVTIRRQLNWRSRMPKGAQVPPGPKGIPILGNMLQIPPIHSWLKFKEWADEYGPLYRFTIMGRSNVVLSTETAANELLRERGTIYSSREHLVMAADLLSNNLRPLLLGYNERWRSGRKLMHRLTTIQIANSYQSAQSHEAKHMLYDLIRDPANYELWFERYAGGLIFRIGYGKATVTGDEEHIRLALDIVHTVERIASPGSYLVDTLPFLRYLPGSLAPFKEEGRKLHAREINFFRTLISDVAAEVGAGVAGTSFVRTWLEEKTAFGLSDDEAAYAIGTLFEAGSGTTAAAMMSFMLALVLYPEWQQRMSDEVDNVCGDRLPDFDDVPDLPVCRAVIKEVLRWRPVTAGGIPHQLVQDDVYKGHFLEKGTNVHANQWAIHRDPKLYPDPDKFSPDRWLKPEYPTFKEPLTKFPSLQNFSAFGFGRRICPGMNIAERSLYLLPSRIAWACRISRQKNAQGEEIIPPEYDYTAGFNTQPKKFPFELQPRSKEKADLVVHAWEDARRNDMLKHTEDYKLGQGISMKK